LACSQSWLAVKGKPSDAVLAELGLRRSDAQDSEEAGCTMRTGWYVTVLGDCDSDLADDAVLARLSRDCDVIAGFVEETVMVSAAFGWRNGHKIGPCCTTPKKNSIISKRAAPSRSLRGDPP